MLTIEPCQSQRIECERVLRSLPRWFGIEESLVEYAQATERFPTFVAKEQGKVVGFITLRRHFDESWEVHCIAVEAELRCKQIGKALHLHAENWLIDQGVRVVQVKTLAPGHPSEAYAETRAFYRRIGYVPLEEFPNLWAPHLPVLQLVKVLPSAG